MMKMVVQGDGGHSDRSEQGHRFCAGEADGGDGANPNTHCQRLGERIKGS
ncbi:hypothetical protein TIFTF001_005807 [Ficus carica]|uniref:Uncharacterized protein n=1 Tax=Ficus carica TaxID=3494 RepID=A0AA87ZH63_FICCA|nr:hypothetical protein TIFTF001_005807 [Ficus carica]